MAVRIAINGFGRIGRMILRQLVEKRLLESNYELVAIADLAPSENLAYLLKYDSARGPFNGTITALPSDSNGGGLGLLRINDHVIRVLRGSDPCEMPWKALGAQIIIESSGQYAKGKLARGHITAGASKVLITALAADVDHTIVVGVNDTSYRPEIHNVVSNGSCTTNCLAPLVHVLLERGIGVDEGFMTTVHSYTSSQGLVDGLSKRSLRAGRAAAMNIIPCVTGAASAVGLVCPEVKGKLAGMAFRVPVSTVSLVDFTFRSSKSSTYQEICAAMEEASYTKHHNIIRYTKEEIVSSDMVNESHSAIFDAGAGLELNDRYFKIVAWYDNEWGYSSRCVELLQIIARA